MRKIEDLINLSDIILDKLENMHIDAKGTVLGEPKSINIGIDISDLNNAEMEITCWDERNPITGKMERKKKATISFTDYEMSCKLQDKSKTNILECLWEASKKIRKECTSGGEKVIEFRFNEDFGNNWKSGQTVTCEEKQDGYLVDKVALIKKDELLKHGEFITMNVQILGHIKQGEKGDLTFTYDRDFQPGDTVQHFKGGFYKIIAIGINTETEEKMVVYQGLKDQRVWIRPYDMFISKVDREKYPNAYQPYRLIKVKITV